jgi:hypothetical protein
MRVCSFFVVGFMDWALFTGVDKYLAKSPGWGSPRTCRLSKFVVGFFRLDSVITIEGSIVGISYNIWE